MTKPPLPLPLFSLLLLLLLLHHHLPLSSSSSVEYWDEDEFEGVPPPPPPPPSKISETPPISNNTNSTPGGVRASPKGVGDYYIEIMSILFLILFLGNYISVKKENERLAMASGRKFAAKDSVFRKNFSLLGVGDGEEELPLLLKEGQTTFKFYASGRRFCQGMLATIELKSRQDLMSRVYNAVVGCKDVITLYISGS